MLPWGFQQGLLADILLGSYLALIMGRNGNVTHLQVDRVVDNLVVGIVGDKAVGEGLHKQVVVGDIAAEEDRLEVEGRSVEEGHCIAGEQGRYVAVLRQSMVLYLLLPWFYDVMVQPFSRLKTKG